MMRTGIGLVAVFLIANPVFGQNNPEAVVKKAIEAHGGLPVLKKFPAGTTKFGGKLMNGGAEMAFSGSQVFAIPGKVRMEMTLVVNGQKSSLLQIVNGDKVRQTENGVVSKLDEPVLTELRGLAVSQEMSLLYPLLDTTKYTLIPEKDVPVGGQDAAVVITRAKGLKDARLFFDKKTGLLVAMQRKGLSPNLKEVDEVTTFTDYKTIDGLVVPMKSKVTHNGKPFMEITVSEYKPMETVDEKSFAIP